MIFYFSGTGNSQLVAKKLADELKDELISVNRSLKSGVKQTFKTDRPLVFVAPLYAWRLPRVVGRWIRETKFEGSQDAYFILTRGGKSEGNAAKYIAELCNETGLNYRGLASVQMPENYIALASAPSESECEKIIERALPLVTGFAQKISAGEDFPKTKVSLAGRFVSGPFNPLYYRFYIKDKGFKVSEACVSCGLCARRCPLNNIDLVDGKPQWKGNCTHCMACIGGCPTAAIEYKSVSKGKRRYYIMDER